ncbi:MAG: hypothetical protein EOS73_25490 [Mesorhizobium sp.]|uniref:hypothetical protein n=1 Tax=Mesorhizobium sp. M7A.F.Ca.ET.027.02.1.1 TaxID=2496655 RepID=UPI000FD4AFEE|nr:hypothetical protein [Mesorhizobium sp. M7A.F.Ca.ET.027.02.1.1]RVD13554.1 hypothetical protein EN749_23050 [Mesorhizobium sp. M7A.F.Ca.ET.027.02.1.1]RWD00508.1 MAG: hypothetical protein EOS73_25490 [Mesorhizobium sp.]
MRRYKVTITTAADGTATAYTPRLSGMLHSIQYVKTDFADGIDFTITSEATGESLLAKSDVNASAVFYPRAPTHSQVGAAALFAAGGTAVQERIGLGNDRVKIAVAQGGNVKTGTVHVLVD